MPVKMKTAVIALSLVLLALSTPAAAKEQRYHVNVCAIDTENDAEKFCSAVRFNTRAACERARELMVRGELIHLPAEITSHPYRAESVSQCEKD